MSASVLDVFGQSTRTWFADAFAEPTAVQCEGWPRIAAGEHSLLIAPTGSGKTLAAFLSAIDRLSRFESPPAPGVRVVYISPLKALAYDIERNLRAPLEGIEQVAEREGWPIHVPRVWVRTGDTPQRARQRHLRDPADILVTTPESLYLMLCSLARETLRTVQTVIVDEIHALAPTKRGAHLSLSLEHLACLTSRDPQRIGLSATVRPANEVARFLGGDRDVTIVDASTKPRLELKVIVPVPDMTNPSVRVDETSPGGLIHVDLEELEPEERVSVWPAIYPRLLELIEANRTTIVFVNSRGLCERLANKINELADCELVLAHHGSIAHDRRKVIEEMLKAGELRGMIATSSLELGIDMGTVDLVVLVESPGSVARGLQRVGRAGHDVGAVSVGRLFPKHRGDLLEGAVVTRRMLDGQIESLSVPRNPLDVLSQQIVAFCVAESWTVGEIERVVRRSANYRELTHELLAATLDMLSGRYPSNEFANLSPRLNWDRDSDELTARRSAAMLARLSGGTIPDRGLFGVFIGPDGPRVGELDEENVYESRVGQNIILGASTWRIEQITRDRVHVSPAPGQPGNLPFWKGDRPGRPLELGREVGRLTREIAERSAEEAEEWLQSDYVLDSLAARNLVRYVHEQHESGGEVPTDRSIVIERFRDEMGDWRVCILTPFGSRVHAPWALAIEARLAAEAGFELQTLWSDDGIVLRLADSESLPDLDMLIPDPGEVEDLIVGELSRSSMFAGQFRENAGRALLLPRRRPGSRTPLWAQRIKAQQLLGVAQRYPSFPIVLETYRSCLQDVFDLSALKELLAVIGRRDLRITEVETPMASPFARSLVFAWVAVYMYEGDIPLAERRAHALTLDRQMLRELLGHDELRELLDSGVIETLEAEMQGLAEERRARHADALHDLLRRVGDLSDADVAVRCLEDPVEWLDELERAKRVVRMQIGGEERRVAVEDVAVFRDAFGAVPPPGLPEVFLEPQSGAVRAIVQRYARTHGPFLTGDLARRFAAKASVIEAELRKLEEAGAMRRGDFLPGGVEPEWCDPDVLRRLRRRTLARLRKEVSPVEAEVLARFLPAWHGIGGSNTNKGTSRLEEVLNQLEGMPLSFGDLESAILPARVADYHPRMLDDLGATGQIVWVGHGALGKRDGRIALYRRDRLRLWMGELDEYDPPSTTHRALLEHLQSQGASFFFELASVCEATPEGEIVEALLDLVWAGRVTNDSFRALRVLGPVKKARRRPRGPGQMALGGGRWSLVEQLLRNPASPTERAHARTVALLGRHGVVMRETADLESIEGGFSNIYTVLKTMEESGRVRRGYFVDGLGGAQFAFTGAVDRLRACRAATEEREVRLMAATDPANPYGWLLPWPEIRAEASVQPKRMSGAVVVLVDGEPVLYVERSGRRVVTFPPATDVEKLVRAAAALTPLAARARGRMLRIEEIDGESARSSPLAVHFRAASFGADYRGLTLEVG